jgi:3-dehydrosphinganine reductase
MDFEGQHAIITGGSSGIGRATARRLARRGAHVSLIARREALLRDTVAELEGLRTNSGQRFRAYSADLSDWTQAEAAVAHLTAGDFPPDILVNSAGITRPGYFQDLPLGTFHEIMDVDFFGTLYPIRAALPQMLARERGWIVNVSSVAGFLGVFGYSAYSAAKFAVRGLSDVLRAEMKPHGIHVLVVFPPDTDTPQLRYEEPLKPPETRQLAGTAQTLSADKVARALLRGIERERAYVFPSWDTRLFFALTNGLTMVFRWYSDFVVRRVRRRARI